MRITIGLRIFLALTLVSLVIVGLSATLTRLNFEADFQDYVDEQEANTIAEAADELADLYWRDGSWDSLRDNPRRWMNLLRRGAGEGPPPGRRPPPGSRPGLPPPDPLALGRRIALLDADGTLLVGPPPKPGENRRIPIDVNGTIVGFVALNPGSELSNPLDQRFADSQQRSTYVVAIAALVIAAIMSGFVARQFTRPIRAVAEGANRIAAGDFESRIDAARKDELGDLARDFNVLAETLEDNRQARQRWVADIAHELRTPLAILRGELDALEDGVRTFDAGTRESLQAEVARLSKLVGDLHDLSVYDEGALHAQLEFLDFTVLLQRMLRGADNRFVDAGITLSTELLPSPLTVLGDPQRLEQLITNLLENTLRYTDAPGSLDVALTTDGTTAMLTFSDSAPGVPDTSLPLLFDRLYRVHESRNRKSGGSGLGLSICKAIVEAHSGTIAAEPSAKGGLRVSVGLPLVIDAGIA
ncbi:MAG: ATP-binding protein [Pseudomonadota bacterium]